MWLRFRQEVLRRRAPEELHVCLRVTTSPAGDFLQGGVEFSVVDVVAAVDAENDEAGGEAAKQFVVVQFM